MSDSESSSSDDDYYHRSRHDSVRVHTALSPTLVSVVGYSSRSSDRMHASDGVLFSNSAPPKKTPAEKSKGSGPEKTIRKKKATTATGTTSSNTTTTTTTTTNTGVAQPVASTGIGTAAAADFIQPTDNVEELQKDTLVGAYKKRRFTVVDYEFEKKARGAKGKRLIDSFKHPELPVDAPIEPFYISKKLHACQRYLTNEFEMIDAVLSHCERKPLVEQSRAYFFDRSITTRDDDAQQISSSLSKSYAEKLARRNIIETITYVPITRAIDDDNEIGSMLAPDKLDMVSILENFADLNLERTLGRLADILFRNVVQNASVLQRHLETLLKESTFFADVENRWARFIDRKQQELEAAAAVVDIPSILASPEFLNYTSNLAIRAFLSDHLTAIFKAMSTGDKKATKEEKLLKALLSVTLPSPANELVWPTPQLSGSSGQIMKKIVTEDVIARRALLWFQDGFPVSIDLKAFETARVDRNSLEKLLGFAQRNTTASVPARIIVRLVINFMPLLKGVRLFPSLAMSYIARLRLDTCIANRDIPEQLSLYYNHNLATDVTNLFERIYSKADANVAYFGCWPTCKFDLITNNTTLELIPVERDFSPHKGHIETLQPISLLDWLLGLSFDAETLQRASGLTMLSRNLSNVTKRYLNILLAYFTPAITRMRQYHGMMTLMFRSATLSTPFNKLIDLEGIGGKRITKSGYDAHDFIGESNFIHECLSDEAADDHPLKRDKDAMSAYLKVKRSLSLINQQSNLDEKMKMLKQIIDNTNREQEAQFKRAIQSLLASQSTSLTVRTLVRLLNGSSYNIANEKQRISYIIDAAVRAKNTSKYKLFLEGELRIEIDSEESIEDRETQLIDLIDELDNIKNDKDDSTGGGPSDKATKKKEKEERYANIINSIQTLLLEPLDTYENQVKLIEQDIVANNVSRQTSSHKLTELFEHQKLHKQRQLNKFLELSTDKAKLTDAQSNIRDGLLRALLFDDGTLQSVDARIFFNSLNIQFVKQRFDDLAQLVEKMNRVQYLLLSSTTIQQHITAIPTRIFSSFLNESQMIRASQNIKAQVLDESKDLQVFNGFPFFDAPSGARTVWSLNTSKTLLAYTSINRTSLCYAASNVELLKQAMLKYLNRNYAQSNQSYWALETYFVQVEQSVESLANRESRDRTGGDSVAGYSPRASNKANDLQIDTAFNHMRTALEIDYKPTLKKLDNLIKDNPIYQQGMKAQVDMTLDVIQISLENDTTNQFMRVSSIFVEASSLIKRLNELIEMQKILINIEQVQQLRGLTNGRVPNIVPANVPLDQDQAMPIENTFVSSDETMPNDRLSLPRRLNALSEIMLFVEQLTVNDNNNVFKREQRIIFDAAFRFFSNIFGQRQMPSAIYSNESLRGSELLYLLRTVVRSIANDPNTINMLLLSEVEEEFSSILSQVERVTGQSMATRNGVSIQPSSQQQRPATERARIERDIRDKIEKTMVEWRTFVVNTITTPIFWQTINQVLEASTPQTMEISSTLVVELDKILPDLYNESQQLIDIMMNRIFERVQSEPITLDQLAQVADLYEKLREATQNYFENILSNALMGLSSPVQQSSPIRQSSPMAIFPIQQFLPSTPPQQQQQPPSPPQPPQPQAPPMLVRRRDILKDVGTLSDYEKSLQVSPSFKEAMRK